MSHHTVTESEASDLWRQGSVGDLVVYLMPYIAKVCWIRTRRLDDDDLCQDIAVKLLASGFRGYDPQKGRILTYVHRVCANEGYDQTGGLQKDAQFTSQWLEGLDYAAPSPEPDRTHNQMDLIAAFHRGQREGIYTRAERVAIRKLTRYISEGTFHFENYRELSARVGCAGWVVESVVSKTRDLLLDKPQARIILRRRKRQKG